MRSAPIVVRIPARKTKQKSTEPTEHISATQVWKS